MAAATAAALWRAVPSSNRLATDRLPFRCRNCCRPFWTLSSLPVVLRRIRRRRRYRCCCCRRRSRRPPSGSTSRTPTVAPSCSYRCITDGRPARRQCRSVGHRRRRSLALVFHVVRHRYMYNSIGVVMNTGATAHETGRQPSGTTAEKISKKILRMPTIYVHVGGRWRFRRDCLAVRPDDGTDYDGTDYDGDTRRVATNAADGFIYLFCFFSRTRGKDKKKKWKWIIWFADEKKNNNNNTVGPLCVERRLAVSTILLESRSSNMNGFRGKYRGCPPVLPGSRRRSA